MPNERSKLTSSVRNCIGGLELLENRRLLTTAFELLLDTNTSPQSMVRSPTSVVDFRDSVAIIAETETSNSKVWLSPDAHDQALMEIGLPHGFHVGALIPFGNDLLISGYSKVPDESGLWRTDGTVSGTERLSSSSNLSVVSADSVGYFFGRASKHDRLGLWRTDGTPSGTRELVTERGEMDIRFTSPLAVLNDRLYFVVADHRSNRYLATFEASTESVRPLISFPPGRTVQIESLSDRLIISNDPGLNNIQEELYSFDPSTDELTKLPFAPGFRVVQTGVLSRLGDQVLFPTYDGILYATDGTVEGTGKFFDFEFLVEKRFPNIASINGNFLVAGYGPQGDGYYFTDGTAARTVHVGLVPFRHPYHPPIAVANDAYYVVSEDDLQHPGLYRIDATGNTFDRIADIASVHSQELPGPFSDFGAFPAVVGERVLFSDRINGVAVLREYVPDDGSLQTITSGEGTAADDVSLLANDDHHAWFESAGTIWQSGGTPDTTFELSYAGDSLYAESVSLSQVIDGKLILEALSTTPSQLYRWQVDPSTGVATRLGELQNTAISEIFELGGNYYQLRIVNGLAAAVFALDANFLPSHRLADIPRHFLKVPVYVLGDRAIFTTEGQLWQTDGTGSGTKLLNLNSDTELVSALRSDVSGIVDVLTHEGRFYQLTTNSSQPEFIAEASFSGSGFGPKFIGLPKGIVVTDRREDVNRGLWFVDRTTGSTTFLVDVAGRSVDVDFPSLIGLAGGRVIAFSGSDEIGYSLWATDGTQQGTSQIAYERFGYPFWDGAPNVSANTTDGRLVLSWFTQELGRELSITDGTALGTSPLSDIASGPANSDPNVAILGEIVLATGATDSFGRAEPFVSDVPVAAEPPNDRLRFFVPEKSAGAAIGAIILPDLSPEQIRNITLIGSISNAEFELDLSSGWLSLSENSFYDFSQTTGDEILLDVTYRSIDETQTQIRRVTVEVEVLDQLEQLSIQDQVFEIDENLEVLQYVGKVEATFDAQLDVTFSLAGGYPFNFEGNTGILRVRSSKYQLDYEVRQEFLLVLQISDGLEAKQAWITIRLRDVNEPPEPGEPIGGVDSNRFDFFSGETSHIVLGADAFLDPEGSKITYRLEQMDGSQTPEWMMFTATTTELFVSPLHDNVGDYTLNLIATDATGLAASADLDVRVFSGLQPWHNVFLPYDVNIDGVVSPIDALIVINQLNSGGRQLADANPQLDPFVDTNGDGDLSPLDALLVVEHLNGPAGEGESTRRSQPAWGAIGWWQWPAHTQNWERRRDELDR